MGKNRSLDESTFYAFRYFEEGSAKAYKMEWNEKGRELVRVYEITSNECNCPGSRQGTCKHEMMVRSKEMYREFSDAEKGPMDAYVQDRIRPLFEELTFTVARRSKHKQGMYDALIYKGRKSNPYFGGEDKVLVFFFDPKALGVPYVKAVVLLENYKPKTETMADEVDRIKAGAMQSLKGAQKAREEHKANEAMQSMANDIARTSSSPYPTILMGGPDDLCTITLPNCLDFQAKFELVQAINQVIIEKLKEKGLLED